MRYTDSRGLTRRAFVKLIGAAGLAAALPTHAASAQRQLAFAHTHTGESANVIYWRDGAYDTAALRRVNALLRDFRTGEVHPIEPALLDFLHEVRCVLECDLPFEVISGYRSPSTNDMLRRSTSGVASGSLHLAGRAIDLRVPGISTARLRDTAAGLRRGGVGYYPTSGFVHLDTGRVRQW